MALLAALGLLVAACGDDTTTDDAGDAVDETQAELEETGEDLEGAGEDLEEAAEDALPSEDEAEDAQESLSSALDSAGLSSLATAVENIDINELTDSAEFTFFAPNDEAFAALSGDEMADLLTDLDQLGDVLRNHVVPERLDAAAIAETESVTTEAGNSLEITVDGDEIMVGDATVTNADVEAGDGIVHVIDRLLIPAQ